jgi:hypothetical protein
MDGLLRLFSASFPLGRGTVLVCLRPMGHLLHLTLILFSFSAWAEPFMTALEHQRRVDVTLPRLALDRRPLTTEEASMGAQLAQRLSELRSSRREYGTQRASPGDVWRGYCFENCACLAREFAPLLRGRGIDVRTLYLRQGPTMGIRIRGERDMWRSWAFHYVVIFRVRDRWLVTDPVGLGSSTPVPLGNWLASLSEPQRYLATLN